MIKKKLISKCYIKILEKVKSGAGFTLIELLVVIVIIGVLATIFMSNFIGVRQRARDSKRKSDLRQIQAAFELYRYDQGGYPGILQDCPNGVITYGTATYMQKIPCDPLGTSYYNSGKYYYTNAGTSYTLCACLENTNDSQGATNSTCSTTPVVVSPACSGATGGSGKFFFLQSQ